jgi:hypothetical protein
MVIMNMFRKNTKGAVTVFVSLLLVPAILISGTAVDLARMHTARSIAQDANQLAANSMLSQYDSLLHDLYALFGVIAGDPELAEMINDYIELAVFGGGQVSSGMGTLQVFYGSDLEPAEVEPASEQHLRNTDVLRRQIEEYMKFRAPIVLVNEFLDKVDANTIKEDAEIIGEKSAIDSGIADLFELYRELHETIGKADKANQGVEGPIGGNFGLAGRVFNAIRQEFVQLSHLYFRWLDSESPEEANDHAMKYAAIRENIRIRTIGGRVGSRWADGIGWQSHTSNVGLFHHVVKATEAAEDFKIHFDQALALSIKIDSQRDELERMVDNLEERLNTGECDPELRMALTNPDSEGKSQIDRYRDILKWEDITSMAQVFKDGGYDYIDNHLLPLIADMKYRNAFSLASPSLTREELAAITGDSRFDLSHTPTPGHNMLITLASYTESAVTYKAPPGFIRFAFHTTRNHEFFLELTAMMASRDVIPVKLFDGQGDASGSDGESKQRGLIKELLGLSEGAFASLKNEPLGAKYVKNSASVAQDSLSLSDVLSLLTESAGTSVIDIIQDPLDALGRAGYYLLFVTYCSEMLSNYTTIRPDANDKTRDDIMDLNYPSSLTGVPISPEVNYFFQSEMEYIYTGDDNASKNLSAITRLLFFTRLICNYIAVFKVSQITVIVNSIRTAFAWAPPLAVVLAELARAAFAAAESVVDIALLRAGHNVPLIKNVVLGEWVCTPLGLGNALRIISSGNPDSLLKSESDGDKQKGLSYSNYLLFFFITRGIFDSNAPELFATRLANLIEYNVINFSNKLYSNEEKMTEALQAENVFRMEHMITDFTISFSINMRMLFLSMPMAQRGINGVIPPRTIPVVAVDYRGY